MGGQLLLRSKRVREFEQIGYEWVEVLQRIMEHLLTDCESLESANSTSYGGTRGHGYVTFSALSNVCRYLDLFVYFHVHIQFLSKAWHMGIWVGFFLDLFMLLC
jgi:hypothetical protein